MYYLVSLILIFTNLLSFYGGLIFYFFSLNLYGIIASLVLTISTFFPIIKYVKRPEEKKEQRGYTGLGDIFQLLYLITAIGCLVILFLHQTTKSIISPWQVVPAYFFALYGLATLILFVMILRTKLDTIFLSLHAILSFSVALTIYKFGYGFDPFIHEAALNFIDKHGYIEPKPLYYLGQYSLIIIAHKLFFIPIAWLNKILVPLLAALLLPFYLTKSFGKIFPDKKILSFATLGLLILPFSIFIISTPQNLAYLFLLLVIIISLAADSLFDLLLIFSLSLAAIITQPIAGIPAFALSILITLYKSNLKTKKVWYALVCTISALALPASFYIVNPHFNFQSLKDMISLPHITIPSQENFIYNFTYLYGFNSGIILAILIAIGLLIFWKNRSNWQRLSLYFFLSLSFLISYFLTQNLSFNYLIGYEQGAYASRILLVSILLLFPFLFLAIYNLGKKIIEAKISVQAPFVLFLVILITTSLYLSYPRFDKYFNSKGYSTGANDLYAVSFIEVWAKKDYIVLANQQVSAAALYQFGFNRYYKIPSPYQGEGQGEVLFYYPIPTSSPLYNYYLDMVYKKPSRETMLKAMDLAGVDEGYFVLNKYWFGFNKIVDEAKLSANSWQMIGDQDIYIFQYKR